MNIQHAIEHLSQHADMRRVIEQTTMPDFTASGDVYYDIIKSIVSQQLSVKAAATIFDRVCGMFPDKYPQPEYILEVPLEQLRAAGLSNQKANYVQNVARFAQENNLEKQDWASMTDDQIVEYLTTIKGVGKWTVQMVMMFTLGRPDIFPVDDLGIQHGMIRLFNLSDTGKELRIKMLQLSVPWSPYRTVAARYLWRWKDQN
jgi:DNA-3-methyladenine glycosylase II